MMHPGRLLAVIQGLEKKTVDPRSVSTKVRRAIVEFYMQERSEVTDRALAALLAVDRSLITRDRHLVLEREALSLSDYDIGKVAAGLQLKKLEYQRRAVSKTRAVPVSMPVFNKDGQRVGFETMLKEVPDPDFRLAWEIELDYIDKMAELGYIRKAPKELAIGLFDLRGELERFFDEYNVRSPAEFAALLRVAGDGRNGRQRSLPPLLIRPADAGGDRADRDAGGPAEALPPGHKD